MKRFLTDKLIEWKNSKYRKPLILRGARQVGKTYILKDFANTYYDNMAYFNFDHDSSLADLFVNTKDPKRIIEQLSFVVGRKIEPVNTLIIFDEVQECPDALNSLKYFAEETPEYHIVAAGNNTTDHAIANTISSALVNRFMHVELEANHENWLSWARHNDIHPSVIGFIQYKPDALFHMDDENLERGWPSPRSWERVSKMCQKCPDKDLLRKAVYGLVGQGYGAEFMAFYELNSEFDNILDIMRDPKSKIVIPERADQKFAMCSAMVYLVWRGKDKADADARLTGFYRICIELSSDFASMALMAAMEGKDKKLEKQYSDALIAHPLFKTWQAKHKDALTKHMKKFNSLSK